MTRLKNIALWLLNLPNAWAKDSRGILVLALIILVIASARIEETQFLWSYEHGYMWPTDPTGLQIFVIGASIFAIILGLGDMSRNTFIVGLLFSALIAPFLAINLGVLVAVYGLVLARRRLLTSGFYLIAAGIISNAQFFFLVSNSLTWSNWGSGSWRDWTSGSVGITLIGLFILYLFVIHCRERASSFKKIFWREVELLSHENIDERMKGISSIFAITKEQDEESKEREISWRILLHWVGGKSRNDFSNDNEAKPREQRADIEQILCSLGYIIPQTSERSNAFNLGDLDLRNLNFQWANFQDAILKSSQLQNTDFQFVKLHGADLSRANMGNAKNLTEKQIEGIVYEESYSPSNLPDGLSIPKHRAYTRSFSKNSRFFVKSDFPESGKNVDRWLQMERKQEQGA